MQRCNERGQVRLVGALPLQFFLQEVQIRGGNKLLNGQIKTAAALCIPCCCYKYRQKNNDTIAGLSIAVKYKPTVAVLRSKG